MSEVLELNREPIEVFVSIIVSTGLGSGWMRLIPDDKAYLRLRRDDVVRSWSGDEVVTYLGWRRGWISAGDFILQCWISTIGCPVKVTTSVEVEGPHGLRSFVVRRMGESGHE